jgi:hypothetical protein
MGILLDPEYWGNAINRMWAVLPPRDNPMSREQTIAFLDIAQKTLDDLVQDKDFHQDLDTLAKLAEAAPRVPPKETEFFRRFLNRFLVGEEALLRQSGMNVEAIDRLIMEIGEIAGAVSDIKVDIRGLEKRLIVFTENLRKARRDEMGHLETENRRRDTWKVIKGCAIVGVDGGSVFAANLVAPIIGALVSGGPALLSIEVGATMVSDVLKDKI